MRSNYIRAAQKRKDMKTKQKRVHASAGVREIRGIEKLVELAYIIVTAHQPRGKKNAADER